MTVVAVGDRNDCGLFRDLLHHGVADYLVKPMTPSLLQKAILAASEQSGVIKGNHSSASWSRSTARAAASGRPPWPRASPG